MFTVWFTPEGFDSGEVELRPLTGPGLYELARGTGAGLYLAFAHGVKDWKNVPGNVDGRIFETYDARQIEHINWEFVVAVCDELERISRLTEDEIKNSASPST